ncbi:MAG: hypothetical protein ACREDR_31335, partial [Blastocatellia bacterium]
MYSNKEPQEHRKTEHYWKQAMGYGDSDAVSVEEARSTSGDVTIVSDLDASLVGGPLRDGTLPANYISPARVARSDDGRLALSYVLSSSPERHPVREGDLDTLECFVNVMWDAVCLMEFFLRA